MKGWWTYALVGLGVYLVVARATVPREPARQDTRPREPGLTGFTDVSRQLVLAVHAAPQQRPGYERPMGTFARGYRPWSSVPRALASRGRAGGRG